MSEYKPDAWVLLRITVGDESIVKVMGGWYGGYLGNNSWRLNSGVTKIEQAPDGEWLLIHGYSGSVYRVHPDERRATMLMSGIIQHMQDTGATVEEIDVDEAKASIAG